MRQPPCCQRRTHLQNWWPGFSHHHPSELNWRPQHSSVHPRHHCRTSRTTTTTLLTHHRSSSIEQLPWCRWGDRARCCHWRKSFPFQWSMLSHYRPQAIITNCNFIFQKLLLLRPFPTWGWSRTVDPLSKSWLTVKTKWEANFTLPLHMTHRRAVRQPKRGRFKSKTSKQLKYLTICFKHQW